MGTLESKNTVTKLIKKKNLSGLNSRLSRQKKALERLKKITWTHAVQITERKRNEEKTITLREMQDTIKCTKHAVYFPEAEERRSRKIIKEIMTENFPNLLKTFTNTQQVIQAPSRINRKRSTTRQFIVKILKAKNKETFSKWPKEKWLITYKWIQIRWTTHLSDAVEARMQWGNIIQVLDDKRSTKNPIPSKTTF